MNWKHFKLLIKFLGLFCIIVSLTIENELMAIFFLLAMTLSELEDMHETIKAKEKEND